MGLVLLQTSDLFFTVLTLIILARVILSWVVSFGGGNLRGNPIVIFIFQVSEPVLRPFQRLVPQMGMMDFSPMVAILVLVVAQAVVGDLIRIVFNL